MRYISAQSLRLHMKILAVAHDLPRPDESSGELRFFTLLSLLAESHEVTLHATGQPRDGLDGKAMARLASNGVRIDQEPLDQLLRRSAFEIVFFEFYFVAANRVRKVRTWQPDARVVVDTVDVHFHRLRSRARLTGSEADRLEAERVRAVEMAVYGQADLVVAVSSDDRAVLLTEGLGAQVAVLPNIHAMHPLQPRRRNDRLELVFVGSYKWSPNVDAMTYFCHEVMPLVREQVPNVRLRIIGSAPTAEVLALAAADIDVLGFVDDVGPYLRSSDISIAPLRYGGGIKGKVGEAMAYGLPVVTTSIGAEGFGFQHGRELLVADTPTDFAAAVAELWRSPGTYERIRLCGWEAISKHLSVDAVRGSLPEFLATARGVRPKRLSPFDRARLLTPHYLEKYVLWRFRT